MKYSVLELFDILRGKHAHEFHSVLFSDFDGLSNFSENWDFFVLLELKDLTFPLSLDDIEFALNLVLLLGTLHQLSHFFSKLVELQLDQVVQAELW